MRKSLFKRVLTTLCATVLSVAMTSTCFAANWNSYFGALNNWYEGADGEVITQSNTGFTVVLNAIGWGGIWGAQMTDISAKATKGKQYTLSFRMKSDMVDKWVFVKMANDKDELVVGDWIQLKAGQTTTYSKTFNASVSATKLVFGMGGEFGDREDEQKIYPLTDVLPNDVDSGYSTTIICSDYSFKESSKAPTIKSVKSTKAKTAKVTIKKVKGVKGYLIQYSKKSSFKGAKKVKTTSTSKTIKKLTSKKKYYFRVKTYDKKGKLSAKWSKTKSVKVK